MEKRSFWIWLSSFIVPSSKLYHKKYSVSRCFRELSLRAFINPSIIMIDKFQSLEMARTGWLLNDYCCSRLYLNRLLARLNLSWMIYVEMTASRVSTSIFFETENWSCNKIRVDNDIQILYPINYDVNVGSSWLT